MEVNDIAVCKECSEWNNGSLRNKHVIIDMVSGSSYSVSGIDGCGGGAWLTDNDLEFVRHGTSEDRESVEMKNKEVTSQQTDVFWIRDNWGRSNWSANSILTLLHAIGYHSSFEKNGEYFILYDDWMAFYPVFDAIMRGDQEKANAQISRIFKPQYVDEHINSVDDLYCKLHG